MNAFVEANRLLFSDFRWAFFAALLLGACIPVAGSFLVLRRVPFLALALPQSAFAGMAIALFIFPHWILMATLGTEPSLDHEGVEPTNAYLFCGAALAVAATLAALAVAGRGPTTTHVGSHAALAYVLTLALGEILRGMTPMGEQKLERLIHGELIATNGKDVLFFAVTVIPATLWLALRRERMLFISAEPHVAAAFGLRTGPAVACLYGLLGTAVAASVPVVGPLVVFALLLAPAVMWRPIARSTRGQLAGSAVLGLAAAYVGSVAATMLDWPLGATIATSIVALGAILNAVLGLARVLGLRRDFAAAPRGAAR